MFIHSLDNQNNFFNAYVVLRTVLGTGVKDEWDTAPAF